MTTKRPLAAVARALMPANYEQLVKQLQRDYPEYTLAEIEAALIEAARTPTKETR